MIDLESVLATGEKVNIEAKRAIGGVPNSVWETYSSFANTAGGAILLGVDENDGQLTVSGVSDASKIIKDIWDNLNNPQKISSNILFESHVYSVDYENKSVVIIEVPRADRQVKPVYVGIDMFKGSFRRNHEGDYHCRRDEVLAMLRDQSEESADNRLLENLLLADLNADSIRRYRTMFKNLRPQHSWNGYGDEEFLVKIGAARRGTDQKTHPTLAGLLMFGEFNIITDQLPNYFLDYREHYSDNTRWTDRVCSGDGDWTGNIFDFYFKIIDRLTGDLKTPLEIKNGIRVSGTKLHNALREALANSLIHSDYYGRRGIVIDKDHKCITISNPGTFRIGIEDAIEGGISDARNSKIFNMFSLINVGERSGTGLCDLYATWNDFGLAKPTLTESVDPDRITLSLVISDSNSGKNDSNHDNNQNENDSNLSSNESAMLELIKRDPLITANRISKELDLSVPTINRLLKSLKSKGAIIRDGGTRGRWIVL